MYFNGYEILNVPIDKDKTWIDVKRHKILSREIHGKYYLFAKKFEISDCKDYFYLIVDGDSISNIPGIKSIYVDDFGRTSIVIPNYVWKELGFDKHNKDFQLLVTLVEDNNGVKTYRIEA